MTVLYVLYSLDSLSDLTMSVPMASSESKFAWLRVYISGFRVWGLGFRIYDARFRFQGSGFRV